VVFRSGPRGNYKVWPEFTWLPVVSVAPGRRPKLTANGQNYSFEEERSLMREKIRTVLRIAAAWGHRDLCVGPFGFGPGFRNPVPQLATMWKSVLFDEAEFNDTFSNVVFAIEDNPVGNGQTGPSDFEIFRNEFDPSNICKTTWRTQAS
jgi:uncharacterized protein (TIGR02452 family)